MSRPSTVPKTDPSPRSAPPSGARPRQPSPSAGEQAERDAAEYARLRARADDLAAEIKEAAERAVTSMRREGRTRISTPEGTVALLHATESRQVTDQKTALALLASKGIPAPPTLEQWFGEHKLRVPTMVKDGLPERLQFTANK